MMSRGHPIILGGPGSKVLEPEDRVCIAEGLEAALMLLAQAAERLDAGQIRTIATCPDGSRYEIDFRVRNASGTHAALAAGVAGASGLVSIHTNCP